MNPNGLRGIYGGKLLVAGWGKEVQDDGATKMLGKLFTIDIATKELKTLGSDAPIGNLDGLERDAHGHFLVTDFNAGALYRVKKDGSHDLLVELNPGSADLNVIDEGRTAMVPLMMDYNIRAFFVD